MIKVLILEENEEVTNKELHDADHVLRDSEKGFTIVKDPKGYNIGETCFFGETGMYLVGCLEG